jgi:transposase-like protein
MNENINIVPLRQPDEIDDPLTNILRSGARQLLAQAVEIEAEAFLAAMKDLKLPDGRDRLVRHGHGPERTIQTGIGGVEVARVRIRDRAAAEDGERIRFTSAILPLWARRTKSLDALLPVLYLRGISTGHFQEALAALLGKDASNLSPAVISRLTAEWQGEYERWQKRDLSARRHFYGGHSLEQREATVRSNDAWSRDQGRCRAMKAQPRRYHHACYSGTRDLRRGDDGDRRRCPGDRLEEGR